MRSSLKPAELAELIKVDSKVCLIDVRKQPAREQSGLAIANSRRELPFEAGRWWRGYRGAVVVVYCVHGHEVSQDACATLRANGVDARYLEGGFEGWRAAGMAVEPIGAGA